MKEKQKTAYNQNTLMEYFVTIFWIWSPTGANPVPQSHMWDSPLNWCTATRNRTEDSISCYSADELNPSEYREMSIIQFSLFLTSLQV